MTSHRHANLPRHSYPHPHFLPSFLRKFPRMSSACLHSAPSLPPGVFEFETSLVVDLYALKPQDQNLVLCLDWLVRGLDLVLAKHKEAVQLIPPFEGCSSPCEEKWVNNYFDQTARILGACNWLSAEIFELEQGNLLLKYAVNSLGGGSSVRLNGGKVSRARESLRQWLDTAHSRKEKSPGQCGALLREMFKGLVAPQERDSRKGFLFSLYGANATTVFVFFALMIALSRDGELLSLSLPHPREITWTAPISNLMEVVTGEARLCISAGSVFWLRDLHDLNLAVTGLLDKLDSKVTEGDLASAEDRTEELTKEIDTLSELVNVFATRLEALGRKQNEMFQAVVTSRSALLDQLGHFGAAHEA